MDLAAAEQACLNPRIANSDGRRQALRDRLLELHPVIDSWSWCWRTPKP